MRESRRLAAMAVAAAAVIAISGAANAADIYQHGGSLKDEPVAAFMPSWAGLYVGGSVGYGRGDIDDKFTEAVIFEGRFDSLSQKDSDDLNGVVYGAHLGYNFQHGDIVFGPEIGINGTTMDGATTNFDGEIKHDINWYATAVGRLGYARDSFLFYGFGGVAWSNVETNGTQRLIPKADAKEDTTFVGWTAGVGVEYALSQSIALRLEYAHVDLGNETTYTYGQPIDGGSFSDINKTDLDFDVVKVGASYRFGGREESLK